jgi:hypothetical protein
MSRNAFGVGRFFFLTLTAACVATALAVDYTVSHYGAIHVTTTIEATVTAETVFQDAVYPASVGQPSFWLDASDTNGWLFAADGITVTNLPSKSGTRRLTTDRGSWIGWRSGSAAGDLVQHYGPTTTVDVATFGGKRVLDFGRTGSRRALIFDPDPDSVAAGDPTNILRNIGTIIQVRNSECGGGWR